MDSTAVIAGWSRSAVDKHISDGSARGNKQSWPTASPKSHFVTVGHAASFSLTCFALGLVSAVPSAKTTVGTVWLPPLTLMT